MTIQLPKRRLIPRWRPIAATLETTEATSTDLRAPQAYSGDPEDLKFAISQWREKKEPGMLGEVLAFSVHQNLAQEVLEIGREAINSGAPITSVQSLLIRELSEENYPQRLLYPSSDQTAESQPFQQAIKRLRSLLRFAPDNSFALLDYAQLQLAVGKPKTAERALRTALSLSPNNRLVLRTAARFLVHSRDFKQAHKLIQHHPRTPTDPWLMASEIALADIANIESSYLSKGKRLLTNKSKYYPGHLTELSGAIAIEEMLSGNLKRAREAQKFALFAPNDNVIAQAIEQEKEFGLHLDTPQIIKALSTSNEALAIQAFSTFQSDNLISHAKDWHAEEPFSSRPIVLLSSTYAYMGEFEEAERWSKAGLIADPEDFNLLVSLAYSLAQLGNINGSEIAMRKLRSIDFKRADPYCKATEGLIAYRQKRFDAGDKIYDEAVSIFYKNKQEQLGAFCRLNQVLSALDYNHPKADEIVKTAKFALEAYPSTDSYWLLKIRSSLSIPDCQKNELPKRRLSQWVFDSTKNSLTERVGITSIGAQPLVVINRPNTG
jgi:hypothetical protein